MSEQGNLVSLSDSPGSQRLAGILSPWTMMRALLLCVVSCLLAVNDGSIINRCTLAKILYEEDLDGFEGYSLPDCECHLLGSFPSIPPLDLLLSFLSLPFVFPS